MPPFEPGSELTGGPDSITRSVAPAVPSIAPTPNGHPLGRVLEAVGLGVAAGVDLAEALRLDPHPLALEQAEDARLAGLGALVLAVGAGRPIVLLVGRRLLVGRDVALVVAQDDLVVRVADQVVGHHRDLAAAAGRVDHVGRDRIAAGVAAQALHDLEALADGRPEMAGALDQVALVEVVRPDPVLDQLVDERALDVDAVVDAGQQDRLVADRQAGPGQLVDRPADLRRDLVRVVEVEVDPQRVVLLEHLAQLVVDPLGQEDGHPRADPDDLDVGDLAQAAQDRLEQLRGEGQAVAAADQHVPDLRRPAQVVELGLVLLAVEVHASGRRRSGSGCSSGSSSRTGS